MGAALRMLRRSAINYNFENRAEKVFNKSQKDRPTMAPRHKTEEKLLDQQSKAHPELLEEIQKKHEPLDDFLTKVRVISTDPPPKSVTDGGAPDSRRLLPQNRVQHEEGEFGFLEPPPDRIPPGKLTLGEAVRMMSEFYENPDRNTLKNLVAKNPRLDYEEIRAALKYFAPFGQVKEVDIYRKTDAKIWTHLHPLGRHTRTLAQTIEQKEYIYEKVTQQAIEGQQRDEEILKKSAEAEAKKSTSISQSIDDKSKTSDNKSKT